MPRGIRHFRGVIMEITPTRDGLITVAQAAALTNRSESAVYAWIRRGYRTPTGKKVKLRPKRRAGQVILLDPVDVAKAAHATDPRGLYRAAAPLPAAA